VFKGKICEGIKWLTLNLSILCISYWVFEQCSKNEHRIPSHNFFARFSPFCVVLAEYSQQSQVSCNVARWRLLWASWLDNSGYDKTETCSTAFLALHAACHWSTVVYWQYQYFPLCLYTVTMQLNFLAVSIKHYVPLEQCFIDSSEEQYLRFSQRWLWRLLPSDVWLECVCLNLPP
jgi:hypothetical protein